SRRRDPVLRRAGGEGVDEALAVEVVAADTALAVLHRRAEELDAGGERGGTALSPGRLPQQGGDRPDRPIRVRRTGPGDTSPAWGGGHGRAVQPRVVLTLRALDEPAEGVLVREVERGVRVRRQDASAGRVQRRRLEARAARRRHVDDVAVA